jgi:hypothetical protein
MIAPSPDPSQTTARRVPAPVRAFLVAFAAAAISGCPAPPTAIARGQQVASEFNQDARFGHTELSMEHVAPSAREAFAAGRRAWGTGLHVADLELQGMKAEGEHELDVFVRISWYRPEEQELRSTTVKQVWRDEGGWQLTAENRLDGDVGLLGEPVVYQAPDPSRPRAQFPTVRLGDKANGDPAPVDFDPRPSP